MKQANPPTPNLLQKLGAMVAIREIHLLEQYLLRLLGPLLGARTTSLYRLDRHRDIAHALHHTHAMDAERIVERTEEIHAGIELPGHVKELLDSLRIVRRRASRERPTGCLVGYPLFDGEALRGFFLFEREHGTSVSEDALIDGVLGVFGNYLGLLDTCQRDRLTGLHNRYALELTLLRLWDRLTCRQRAGAGDHVPERRAAPLEQAYWVGILDIDRFKLINDLYGHMIGDEVLLLIARLLENTFRRHDMVFRYGGEEFVVILAAADAPAAAYVFERVRAAVDDFLFPQVGRVTVSGGFCQADPDLLPQMVISRADRALYEAKGSGRNRIFDYATLIDAGVLEEVPSGTIDLF